MSAEQVAAREQAGPIDVTADSKGRVPLGGVGIEPGRRYRAEPLGDGSDRVILTPLASVRSIR